MSKKKDEVFKCETCNKKVKNKQGLLIHNTKMHKNQERDIDEVIEEVKEAEFSQRVRGILKYDIRDEEKLFLINHYLGK